VDGGKTDGTVHGLVDDAIGDASMNDTVPFTGNRVREVAITTDQHTCISFGTTRSGKPVTILAQAIVAVTDEPQAAPEHIIVLATNDNERRLSALANQGEMPVRARALFDGACWEIMSLLGTAEDAA